MKAVESWRESRRPVSRSRLFSIAYLTTLFLTASEAVHACAVCFGNAEGKIIDGLNFSIIFMLGITYFILGVFVFLFIKLRRRESLFTSTPERTRKEKGDQQTSPAY